MPDLRQDPIIGRWVIIATGRSKQPSDFNQKPDVPRGGFCPLCPGNEDKTPPEVFAIRDAGTRANTPGWKVRVVPNKFPVLNSIGNPEPRTDGLYDKTDGVGNHEIILETPDHTATMSSRLSPQDYYNILLCYRQRILDLKHDRRYQYISIFKNYGRTAGAALEHPNSQLIALPIVPKRTIEELEGSQRYFVMKKRRVYCGMIAQERGTQERLVHENENFLALEPFASRSPFETWVLPEHVSCFEHTDEALFKSMAEMFSTVFKKIDAVLNYPPFNFILHTCPLDDRHADCYHWHFEITPWLSNPSGFEWGTGFYINPTAPEEAARFLREAASDRRQGQMPYFGMQDAPKI